MYSKLLQSDSPAPILSRGWASFVSPTFQLSEHWSLVQDNSTENHKNDLLWPVLLHVVKVRDSLENWGATDSRVCACCPRLETIAHCFFNCARVKGCGIDFFQLSESRFMGYWICGNFCTVSNGSVNFNFCNHMTVMSGNIVWYHDDLAPLPEELRSFPPFFPKVYYGYSFLRRSSIPRSKLFDLFE